MRPWLLPLLRCVRCDADDVRTEGGGCACGACGARYPARDGVYDFLGDPHPAVEREIAAVASLDSHDPEVGLRIATLVRELDREEVAPGDPRLDEFPSFRESFATRRHTRQMLARRPPEPGCVAVELGADHCLATGPLLDAGCRVVAVDITDHLALAPRAGHERLARLRADMNRLPLAGGVADLVWATACVHHSWDLEQTFREARRVLRPRGRFVLLGEPMPAWPRYLAFGAGRRFGREQRELGINETLHPREAWMSAARRAGFEPRLVFPDSTARRLPAPLRGSGPLARRLRALLQVSIHMVAELS
ncbi:MAG: class I SAM-dependent methyltransferase [Thermoanaerobaculia bacterium]|nr:class I SAM-dependent methyltransferase [Thermoanaerobaculia bacterium]